MATFFKYLGMIGSALLAWPRLMDVQKRKKWSIRVLCVLFALGMAAVMCLLHEEYAFLRFPLMFLCSWTFLLIVYREAPGLTLIGMVIAYSISHLLSILGYVIASLTTTVVWLVYLQDIPDLITYIAVSVIQMVFTPGVFRTKYLRNGAPFLQTAGQSTLGVMISLITLFLVSVMGAADGIQHEFVAAIVLAAASGALVTGAWFREKFQEEQRSRTEEQKRAAMKAELKQRDEKVANLQERDMKHGAAVHSYRRAVRAMEAASEDFLAHEELPPSLREEGLRHVETLRSIDREYGMGFTKIGSLGREPVQTHIRAVDMMLRYLQKLAADTVADLQISVHGHAPDLCAFVEEEHISTLLGDLVENALIAVKTAEEGRVLVEIETEVEPYRIDIYDNGPDFPAEVISRLGREMYTTHPADGGSGHGLIAVLWLCRKYGASFSLDEFAGGGPFTKRVSLCFDGENGIKINSSRPEIRRILNERGEPIPQ